MSEQPDILDLAARWQDDGHKVAIATVISTWGSAPRPAGSQLIVRDDGLFEGSVSGGCIEGAVATEAADVIANGNAQMLEFGVSNADAWNVGLACGGQVRVYLETLERPILDQLNAARRDKIPTVLATNLKDGRQWLFPGGKGETFDIDGADVTAEVRAALKDDRPRTVETGAGEIFLNPFNPPLRMVIIGAVHIAQILVPMATLAGFRVTIIDPRGAFAEAERFADTDIVEEWPDDALEADPPDSRTAVITLTHDPKLDDAALAVALKSEAFYIGALGSRKTHAARLERLTASGFDADMLAHIDAPIGLDIGARSPAEIAVAILAKVVADLRTSGK